MRQHGGQIQADIKSGVVSRKYYYFIPMLIGFLTTYQFFREISGFTQHSGMRCQISVGDCILALFQGMPEYIPSQNNPFDIPMLIILLYGILALLIGNVIKKEITGFGIQKMIKTGKRVNWWRSKCVCSLVIVVTYYVSLYLGVLLACLIHAGLLDQKHNAWFIHQDIYSYVFRVDMNDSSYLLGMVIILTLLTSVSLSLLQISLELYTVPAVCYITILMIIIFSAFYMKWYLPGNYLMVFRYEQVNPNGVSFLYGIITNLALIGMSYLLGSIRIKKYDFINKGRM